MILPVMAGHIPVQKYSLFKLFIGLFDNAYKINIKA
jgi:hypothetical protein